MRLCRLRYRCAVRGAFVGCWGLLGDGNPKPLSEAVSPCRLSLAPQTFWILGPSTKPRPETLTLKVCLKMHTPAAPKPTVSEVPQHRNYYFAPNHICLLATREPMQAVCSCVHAGLRQVCSSIHVLPVGWKQEECRPPQLLQEQRRLPE